MNIKKQIILDDKDYERLVHDANLSNDEIKSKIASALTTEFDKRDKMYLVGYNNAGFDNNFLRALFTQCGDKYFGSWLYPNCMDVYVMVTPFLMGVRNDMENFKLMTVARTMGIEIDENKLHDATYDIELTRDIFYRIIGKMDVKL